MTCFTHVLTASGSLGLVWAKTRKLIRLLNSSVEKHLNELSLARHLRGLPKKKAREAIEPIINT
eukprot:2339936-Alexandrium_andersonii.AAC.1